MKKYILIMCTILVSLKTHAQTNTNLPDYTRPTPSVASLMNFNDIPVDYFTGTPDISIPLQNFPTRSKDIELNIGLKYNPANIALVDKASDVGLGWSLFCGGSIARTIHYVPDETYNNIPNPNNIPSEFDDHYSFNFMGYSGSFLIKRDIPTNTFTIQIKDDNNAKLKIDYDINPTTLKVNSFTIYNNLGYKFYFDVVDTNVSSFYLHPGLSMNTNKVPLQYTSAHHLRRIDDNNGKTLMTFNYNSYNTNTLGTSLWNTNINKLSEITINGYGKATFTYSLSLSENKGNDVLRLNEIKIQNYNNEIIKSIVLQYGQTTITDYNIDNTPRFRRLLAVVKIKNNNSTDEIKYNLAYKERLPQGTNSDDYVVGYDEHGFLNLNKNCDVFNGATYMPISKTDPKFCMTSVLEKINYPTGGSVLFDFESHRFKSDLLASWDSEYYYTNNDIDNIENVTFANVNYNTATSNSYQFTISETKNLHFNFTNVPFYYPPGMQPDPNNPQLPSVSYVLTKQNDSQFIRNFGTYICDNCTSCLGTELNLLAGTYTLKYTVPPSTATTGTITITEKKKKPVAKEWVYGGGIRIKQIAHFERDVNQDYFEVGSTYTPIKIINYNYDSFSNSNKTSGITFPGFADLPGGIFYENVKVTTSPNLGYELFEFEKPDKFPYTTYWPHLLSLIKGNLLSHKIYNASNQIVSETTNTYAYEEDNNPVFHNSINFGTLTKNSWAKLTHTVSKNYFYDSNNNQSVVQLDKSFLYNSVNKEISETTSSNSLGETLTTKYFYHTGNSVYSQNRISQREKVETYRNTNLLSTGKINYNNTWTGNVSFLPSSTIGSKAGQTLETLLNYTAYDEYSNPTEIRQQNGSFITYLWGYNKTQVIAKIENASNAQVATVMGVSNVNLITETNMTAINNLRTNAAMVAAMITTYTYIPLVGMRTLIDPKGDQMTYDYDAFNRLKAVRDKDNKILSESEYHISTNSQDFNFVKNISYKIPTDTSITSPPIASAFQNKTFMDGLGRPIQEIAHQQASNGKDIVLHIEYDTFGRQTKNYLPYVNTTASLDYNPNAKTELLNYPDYVGQYPYSETAFEASPLGRVLEKAAPGSEWQINNVQKHTVRIDYQTNTSADAVKKLTAVAQETTFVTNGYFGISLVNGGFYTDNELFKTIVKNENWVAGDGDNNTVHEFRDKEGRVVLKRTFAVSVVSGSEINTIHDIYNVYDQYGNLTYVIPPKADGVLTPTVLNNLCYQYRYDHKNRVVEKKLPGKQWEFIVYDKLNRVVAMGPTLSPFTDAAANTYGWLITKYDALNRKILSAWMPGTTTSAGRKTLQTNYNGAAQVNESKTATNTTVNNVAFRYSNLAYPTTGYYLLTLNYYDDYNYTGAPTVFTTVMNDNSQTVYYNNTTFKPKGLVTGAWVRMVETRTMNPVKAELSHVLYDKKARVVRTRKTNYLGGYTQVDNKIDFAGKVLVTETRHKRTTEAETYIREDFSYSDQDQLVKHTHKIGLTGTPRLLSKNEYDPLGRLVTKRVGGTNITTPRGLQKIDYSYNIRGWLTGINDTNNLAQGTDPLDMFALKINYNTVQNEFGYTGKALYNGNIAETYWKSASDQQLRKYGYKYDHLNRLKEAIYQRPGYLNPVPNTFNETIKYDKNGNITNLVRTGDSNEFAVPQNKIDDLTYGYATDSNTLIKVTDNPSTATSGFIDGVNLATEYTYDANGNMVKDLNKGIGTGTTNGINYNHLNLPHKILLATGNVQYWYNASGQKIKKVVTQGSTVTTTDYLDGFQYKQINAGAVTLEFFGHAEGFIMAGKYVFQYKDHLGNVRLSYTDANNDGAITTNEIVEENHYYPYGLKHSGYNNPPPPTNAALKYRYNTREWQDELGLNITAMDFRQYDNALGRFNCIDALAEASTMINPYQFSNNNPMFFSDPTGLYVNNLNSGSAWLDEIWSQTPVGSRTSWENVGFADFEFTGGGPGTSHLYGSWVSYTGTFNSTGGGLHVNLPEIVVSWKQNSGGRNIHITDNLGGIAQSLAYWNSPYYEFFRDLSRTRQLDDFQNGLSVLGSIEPTGLIDFTNAIMYGLRGQRGNAAIAALAILPFGDLAKAVKIQTHHIIPRAVFRDAGEAVQNAMELNGGFNLKKLPTPFHGNHPQYNTYVTNRLNKIENITEGSIQSLQRDLNSMLNTAYDNYKATGQNLNDYFRQFNID